MSSNLATARPRLGWIGQQSPLGHEDDRRIHLEVVATRTQRRARPRIVYAIIGVGVLFAIVAAQLLVSIAVSQGAYQLNTLQNETKKLQRSYQVSSESLDRLSSPQNLAANANALGMVSNNFPVYLRLSDGAVIGTPVAAQSSAGTVTGSGGNLVPNSLLAGIPLVKLPKAAPSVQTPVPAVNPASPSAPSAGSTAPTVPLTGALPSPVTH
jgi:hypothetical protein